ncbi:MAG: hypothetical protein ACYCOO_05670 [Chitinophagaceae bacterium]
MILWLTSPSARAQSWEEWFQQNTTRMIYLKQQQAALQQYLKLTSSGYGEAARGLTRIGKARQTEWNLEQRELRSLLIPNPFLAHFPGYRKQMARETLLLLDVEKGLSRCRSSGRFSPQQITAMQDIYLQLSSTLGRELESLMELMKNGSFRMSDDARMRRLGELEEKLHNQYAFTQHFLDLVNFLTQRGKQQRAGAAVLSTLYGLP